MKNITSFSINALASSFEKGELETSEAGVCVAVEPEAEVCVAVELVSGGNKIILVTGWQLTA